MDLSDLAYESCIKGATRVRGEVLKSTRIINYVHSLTVVFISLVNGLCCSVCSSHSVVHLLFLCVWVTPMLTPHHLKSEVLLFVSHARAHTCSPHVDDPHKCLQVLMKFDTCCYHQTLTHAPHEWVKKTIHSTWHKVMLVHDIFSHVDKFIDKVLTNQKHTWTLSPRDTKWLVLFQ